MSPGDELDVLMLVLGDAGQRRARLALAAGQQRRRPCRAAGAVGVLVEERRQAVEIAELAGDLDDAAHRPADDDDLAARPAPRRARSSGCRPTLEAKVVTATRPGASATIVGELARDLALARAAALAHGVGRIADQRQHALVAERREARLVGRRPERRASSSSFQSPVWSDRAERRADRERIRLRDRVRDGDVLDVERPDGEALRRRDDRDRDPRRARLARRAWLEQAGGEGGRVDRHLQPRPEVEQRAEMVLVRMGDDDAGEIASRSSSR